MEELSFCLHIFGYLYDPNHIHITNDLEQQCCQGVMRRYSYHLTNIKFEVNYGSLKTLFFISDMLI